MWLIVNPNSTSQNDAVLRAVARQLRTVPGLRLKVLMTHYPGHAEEMVRGVRRSDVEAIIALGGDGTVNEIINGMLGPVGQQVPAAQLPRLGIVPTGSANVFVRSLGFEPTPAAASAQLADALRAGRTRSIRLGTFEDRWFAINAGFGVDADVLAAVDKARAKGRAATPARYLAVTAQMWRKALKRPPRIEVSFQQKSGPQRQLYDVPLLLASNTNPWTFLGPLPVVTNPHNSLDRGLGMFCLNELDGFHGLAGILHFMGASWWFPKEVRESIMVVDDIEEIELTVREPERFQADGELRGKLRHVRLSSVADVVDVFVP